MTPYTRELLDCYDIHTPIYNQLARESQNFLLFSLMDEAEITLVPYPLWPTS